INGLGATLGMRNPFSGGTTKADVVGETAAQGIVVVTGSNSDFKIQGYGKDGSTKVGEELTARR
ncbi:MAG: hypothetical protein WAW45_06725, partial [Atribacterota bacterium]